MTTIQDLLNPDSIAIVGASDNPSRIGGLPLAHLLRHGYRGAIYPVNPTRDTVQGIKSYPDLQSIPGNVEFVLVAVPAKSVLDVVAVAVEKGAQTVMIFSSGFAEAGPEGLKLQQKLADIAEHTGLRIFGPNCLGCFNIKAGFLPTFSATPNLAPTKDGRFAIISQSGAVGTQIYASMTRRGLGLNFLVTTGNEVDLHVADVVDMLANSDDVDVILAYAEGIKDGPKLIEALETARTKGKPVIFLKVGRSDVGAEAIASHTASMAGEDAVYDAIFKQYGAWRVNSIDDMLDIAVAAEPGIYPNGNKVGIVSISGGGGILMADTAEAVGLDVSPMPIGAQQIIKKAVPFCAPGNPVDTSAQIMNDLSAIPTVVNAMLEQGGYSALVSFWSTAAGNPALSETLMSALKTAMAPYPERLFLQTIFAKQDVHDMYRNHGFPTFEDMSRAIQATAAILYFGRSFAAKQGNPIEISNFAALPSGAIGEQKAKAILAAADLPMVSDVLTTSATEAANAVEPGKSYAMKIASADILHKSDIGGVVLGVETAQQAHQAFDQILSNSVEKMPEAQIDGVLMSPMIHGGVECILGGKIDPVFGPMVLFGLGGVFTEVLHDTVLRHAPFGPDIAREMIDDLKGSAILKGARGGAMADLAALSQTIARFSQFLAFHADTISSVEINPLLAQTDGCIALDAVVVLA